MRTKAAADKEWDQLQTIPAWQESKVRSKPEVIDEAEECKTVHFATLMEDHIAGENTLQFGAQVYSYAPSDENFGCEGHSMA